MVYFADIFKGVIGMLFVSTGLYFSNPKINTYINNLKGPVIYNVIKNCGSLEIYFNKCSKIINGYILNPVNKLLCKTQEDLLFIYNGEVTNKYFKNNYNGMKKSIKPYDTVVSLFYIENNDKITTYIQALDKFDKNNIVDNYKISNIKFINIYLYNYGKKHKIICNYNFYVCENILFKESFIKWLFKIKTLDNNYYIKIIDHEAKVITLRQHDYIIINLNDYKICRETDADEYANFFEANNSFISENASIGNDDSSSDDDSDFSDADEDRYWSNIDTTEISKHES